MNFCDARLPQRYLKLLIYLFIYLIVILACALNLEATLIVNNLNLEKCRVKLGKSIVLLYI